MVTAGLLYGPSFTALQRAAFSRAEAAAETRPESVLLFENNDAVREAHVDQWASKPERNVLQLNTDGLAAFVSRAHDRLVDPAPEVGVLERQRTIEQALGGIERIEDARRYSNAFSELFRVLEAHGVLTPSDLTEELAAADLDSELVEVITTVFKRYCEYRGVLTRTHALTQSHTFLDVAEATGSLAEAFSHVNHVIVSGYVDPSPVEVAVLQRVAAEFPTTILLPAIHGRVPDSSERIGPKPVGTDSVLSATVAAYEPLNVAPEFVPPDEENPVRNVAGRLYSIAATGESIDAADRISWHEALTPDREVRHLARRLRERVGSTEVDPEDLLVFAPGLLSYRERIDDIFPEYEIPYAASVSILLERTYTGRAVLDAAALCANPDAEQLTRLATNPVVTLEGIDTAALTSLVSRLPSSDIESLHDHADESVRGPLEKLHKRTDAVRRADGTRTLEAFGLLLDSFSIRSNLDNFAVGSEEAAELGSDESSATARSIGTKRAGEREVAVGYEKRAIERVRRIIGSLAPVLEGTANDPMDELESALQGVRIPPPKQLPNGRVRVVGLEDIPMADYSHLYVLGATRGNLPSDPDRPRYFQTIGDALDLLPENRNREIARYRFGVALANAETVHFTTPAETMQGEDVLESPMLDELRTVAEIKRTEGLDGERRGSREDVQRALAGADPDQLDDPLTAAAADGVFSTTQIDAMRASARACANRAAAEPTIHDGRLDTDTISSLGADIRKEPYSPSRLNTYAKCGFKYYLNEGLKLSEPDEFSPDVGRFAIGDVIHQSLERFYEGLLDDYDEPVRLGEYQREELERRLLAAGHGAIDEIDEDFESPFDRHQLRTVFAGLGDPSENQFYGPQDGAARDRDARIEASGLLVSVLDRELSDDGGYPRFVEAWVGNEETPATLNDGTVVPVHGKIDRIDLAESEQGELSVRVIDYKTYDMDAKDAVSGLDFQLPSYLLGVKGFVEGKLGTRPDAVDGEYRVFKPPSTVTHPASLAQRVEWDLEADIDDFLEEVVPEWIETAVTGIESGSFQPAVIGEDAAGCHTCDFVRVCDVRHHRRFETIEAIDEDDHPAYVPAGLRHGELTDHVTIGRPRGTDR